MASPPLLSPESLEYQLVVLHCRQDGFLPPSHRTLQYQYRALNVNILTIVENTYTGILTVVLGEVPSHWSDELAANIRIEAAKGAAVLTYPEVRFGSFSCREGEG